MAPPVVFLPGLLEPFHVWRPAQVAMGLVPGETFVADLPGHSPGDTPRGTARALLSGAWLDELAGRIAAQFGGRPAMVVGHSTGGLLAIALARRHPGLVDRLVLVNALTRLPRTTLRSNRWTGLLGTGANRLAFNGLWRLWLSSEATFARGFTLGAVLPADLPHLPAMRARIAALDPMAVRTCAKWVLRADVTDDLAHIDVPILALIGRRDPVVPPEHQIGILRTAPNAHARLIDGGHLLFAEAARDVNAALLSWRNLEPERTERAALHIAAAE